MLWDLIINFLKTSRGEGRSSQNFYSRNDTRVIPSVAEAGCQQSSGQKLDSSLNSGKREFNEEQFSKVWAGLRAANRVC